MSDLKNFLDHMERWVKSYSEIRNGIEYGMSYFDLQYDQQAGQWQAGCGLMGDPDFHYESWHPDDPLESIRGLMVKLREDFGDDEIDRITGKEFHDEHD